MSSLDLGVKRAIVATLIAAGNSPALAAEHATDSKIAAGVAYLQIRFSEAKRAGHDDEASWGQAFQDLKRWTLNNL